MKNKKVLVWLVVLGGLIALVLGLIPQVEGQNDIQMVDCFVGPLYQDVLDCQDFVIWLDSRIDPSFHDEYYLGMPSSAVTMADLVVWVAFFEDGAYYDIFAVIHNDRLIVIVQFFEETYKVGEAALVFNQQQFSTLLHQRKVPLSTPAPSDA